MKCEFCNQNKKDVIAYSSLVLCLECLDLLSSSSTCDATNWMEVITPTNLDNFIGQEHIKKEFHTMIEASKIHNIPIQHCLLSGSFGLGKTTLAKILASMTSEKWEMIIGSSIKEYEDFPDSRAIVIDEIHTIKNEEILLHVMDKGRQTLIGATTNAGNLSGPLRSRFISLVLQPYTVEELRIMVENVSAGLGFVCPEYVSLSVAQRAKFVARTAILLFKRVYDRIVLNGNKVESEMVDVWFKEMGIDYIGLDNADRAYLNCLTDKPIGLQNISAMIGLDTITIQETIEPFLLTKGYIKRTSRGRILGDRKPMNVWR